MGISHRERKLTLTITNLVVHYSVTDAFDKTTQFICILDVVEKALDLSLFCQWFKLSKDIH